MEVLTKVLRCRSKPDYVMVGAYTTNKVVKAIPAYRDALTGKDRTTALLPEYEFFMLVRLPSSIADYPRYCLNVIQAKRKMRGEVMRRYLKKNPIGAC